MTIILLILLEITNASILKEEIQDQKLFISLKPLDNYEIMNFYNIKDEFIDQIKCTLNNCSCYFTSESQVSGLINNINCQTNMISFFRTNINVKTITKQRGRITTETYTDSDMPNSQTISSGFTLKWKFNSDETIEFATIWNKLTWLGIGFGSNMKNVDMITINVSGSTVSLIDLYSTSDTTPPTDLSQDYTLISYLVGTSSVSTRFARKLTTGDSKDKTLTKGSTYTWCYAYSNAQSMEMHTFDTKFSITLSDNPSTSQNDTTSTSSTDTSSTSSANASSTTSTGTTSSSSTSSDTSSSSSTSAETTTDTSTSTNTSNTTETSASSSNDTSSSTQSNATSSSNSQSSNNSSNTTSSSDGETTNTSTLETSTLSSILLIVDICFVQILCF